MHYEPTITSISMGLPDAVSVRTAVLLGLTVFLCCLLLAGLSYLQLPRVFGAIFQQFSSEEGQGIYQRLISPYLSWLSLILILIVIDIAVLTIPKSSWIQALEFPLGLLVTINISVLGFKLSKDLFDKYLLEVALENERIINSDLLALGKFLTRAAIVLIGTSIFAQTHRVNLIGLVASLGITGVAIAFASQKILEQILWSVVLYIDRPFIVGDYIHLPDATLGRVETIGWRSTQVRLSGKNTLVIVPNSNLAQVNIENLTRARRVILIVDLNFFRAMADEEKALIHQLILDSTSNIIGIDHQLTKVIFQDSIDVQGHDQVQAKATFFVLGAAENSMELRKSLLEITRINIIERLHNYGIAFDFEERTLDITQPMNM